MYKKLSHIIFAATAGVALTASSAYAAVGFRTYVDFESALGYTLEADNNGQAALSTDQSLSPTTSAELSLTNTSVDFAKVVIDVAPGELDLNEARGTFWAYLASGSAAYLPYMYFGVDTDGNGSFSFGDDSFVIAFITDGPEVLFDTWQIAGIDQSTDVHVVGNRSGLTPGTFVSGDNGGAPLSTLSSTSTGSGLWGDLDVLEIRVGIGETGSDIGPHSVFVDNISVVPEPSSYALLLGVAMLGLLGLRGRFARKQ